MSLQKKTPVVTIMGHVDHGKTSLLDYIRQSKLTSKEFGEITQAIGAYKIKFKGEEITFVDTPGHEAFFKIRSRGAKVADLVVLVVSAVDGVMPQTKESIKVIKESQTPFLVAINKIDLPDASVDMIKGQLAENEVLVEGYGGDVVAVPVSAKTGKGIDQLLEMILLLSEMQSLKADAEGELLAEVVETKADKFCGLVVSLIIKNGTLKKGMEVQSEEEISKVKMIKDEFGSAVLSALPGDPVQVLGFSSPPAVGSLITLVGKKEVEVKAKKEEKPLFKEKIAAEKKLKIILKADVFGSLEAILGCLPEEVAVAEKGVGEINESDVLLAKTLKAEIYGFNLSPSASILKLAETEKVKVRIYKVIYDLLKNIEERILKILEPNIDKKILGKAEILAVFKMKGEKIAGAKVVDGKINKGFPVLIQRVDQTLAETRIISLKQEKQDINEALVGSEFGAVFAKEVDFQPGDVVLSYSLEEK